MPIPKTTTRPSPGRYPRVVRPLQPVPAKDKARFPAGSAGLDRAGSYGAASQCGGISVAGPAAMGSTDGRGVGKTHDLDGRPQLARSILSADHERTDHER